MRVCGPRLQHFFQCGPPYKKFAYPWFKLFIEFITIDKTVPFNVGFAYRGVLHAPINRDKCDLAV